MKGNESKSKKQVTNIKYTNIVLYVYQTVAYKHGDGKKIDGRRVIVDVERGRTVSGWLPRRLGGGLGGTRNRAIREERSHSMSQDRERGPSSAPRGPFRDRSEADNRGRRQGSRDEANGGRRDGGYRDREDRGHRGGRERRDRDRGDGPSKRRGTRSRSGSRDRSSRRERKGTEDVGTERVSARDRLGTGKSRDGERY